MNSLGVTLMKVKLHRFRSREGDGVELYFIGVRFQTTSN